MTLHLISSLVILLVVAGVVTRRRTAIHMRFMTAAFITDLGLVLYIEGTRHAVETVASHTSGLVWFHAGVSTLVMALYIAQLTIGRRMLAGQVTSRRLHIALGMTFCLCRALNYVTAFAVTGAVNPATTIEAGAMAPPAGTTLLSAITLE